MGTEKTPVMKYTVTSKPWKSIFNKVQTLFKSIKQENRANQSTSKHPNSLTLVTQGWKNGIVMGDHERPKSHTSSFLNLEIPLYIKTLYS